MGGEKREPDARGVRHAGGESPICDVSRSARGSVPGSRVSRRGVQPVPEGWLSRAAVVLSHRGGELAGISSRRDDVRGEEVMPPAVEEGVVGGGEARPPSGARC